jgi:hypothetical protein
MAYYSLVVNTKITSKAHLISMTYVINICKVNLCDVL